MDYKELAFWFSVGQWLFNLGLAAWLWFSRSQAATKHRLDSVEQEIHGRIERIEKSMVRVQAELVHLPTQRSMEQLNKDIVAMTREMAQIKGRLDTVSHTASLINEFLIHEGSKNYG